MVDGDADLKKIGQKFGAITKNVWWPPNIKISARFRLDREYLRNATRFYRQTENGLQTAIIPALAHA